MTVPLVVGLGSHAADDCAGWLVVDRLIALGYDKQSTRRLLVPIDILDYADCNRRLVICDACQGAGVIGSIHSWKWPTESVLPSPSRGTHDINLPEVLALGRNLGTIPHSVEIWGIEGHSWQPGTAPSDRLHPAAQAVALAIWSKYSHA
jgi:hydrogenase maturation protease